DARGIAAVIAPSIGYGVTECAAGVARAGSGAGGGPTAEPGAGGGGPPAAREGAGRPGQRHPPPADARSGAGGGRGPAGGGAGAEGLAVSVACRLWRRWARTLSAEFKSGACHAGRYETSIVMARDPSLVVETVRATLPEVPISLSDELARGVETFAAMGMER